MTPRINIWLLQYGPCWCGTVPNDASSFDYVRVRRTVTELGAMEENLLIVSDRVINGSARSYLQAYQDMPEPRLVISAAACPNASRFWGDLPNGWSPVDDIIPIDIHVEACISGRPEELMVAVLGYVLSRDESSRRAGRESRWFMQEASTDA